MARKKKEEKISTEQLANINDKIYPYDLIVQNNPEEYIFRKPTDYKGTAPALIERGFGMQTYLKVTTEKEAVKEIKRLLGGKNDA